MLKGVPAPADLAAARDRLFALCAAELDELSTRFGIQAIQRIEAADTVAIAYPVREYPAKVSAWNLAKTPEVSGRLLGIKGQYLILDSGVLNVRKFTAYEVSLEI
jgi:hypothetical protein